MLFLFLSLECVSDNARLRNIYYCTDIRSPLVQEITNTSELSLNYRVMM